MKKILLLTTGGTIVSLHTKDGLVPSNEEHDLLYYLGSMKDDYAITIDNIFNLDSTNIQPEEWVIVAKKIDQEKNNYDAIVITHGTDTMAYTSSVLSYMLLGIEIPVVITGSQLPIAHPLSDAIINLRCAFEMANTAIGGVFVAFNRHIILGTRASKVRTSGFNAFESINVLPVGIINSDGLQINQWAVPKQTSYQLKESLDSHVFLLKLTPGTDPHILPAMANLGCHGIVIEAFGAGGINFIRRDLVSMLDQMQTLDIPIVVCSQCLYDRSDLNHYEVGRKALEKGVISAYDMTSESAVTKLMWGLGQLDQGELRIPMIRELFEKNLVGEME
ncbi:asparaginase [Tannockella kyphosi]|uniref:asparaginase n=1 Tax=Tannockella kyphosi TaxID=2899121 RepID=UPI002012D2C2|nr:asparaginase [Tannockella kyphosi]